MLACLQDKKPAPERATCLGYSGKTAEEPEAAPPTKEELIAVLATAYPLDVAEQKADVIMQIDGYEACDREEVLSRMHLSLKKVREAFAKEPTQ